jgi:integrase
VGKPKMFPDNVTAYRDRHGKLRLRFRKKGLKPYTFKAPFGTKAWEDEYAAARGEIVSVGIERCKPGSIDDLVARYYLSQDFRGQGEVTQAKNRGILEAFRAQHGSKRVAAVRFEHILAAKAAKHPFAAKNLRKQLRRLFEHAVKCDMIDKNPVNLASRVKAKSKGFYSWTEDDIRKFHETHPLGTMARLAVDLMLWTGMRRSDAVRIGRQHIKNSILTFDVKKSGDLKTLRLPIAAPLAESIMAMPRSGQLTLILTAYGQPFSAKGFGDRMRKWCDEAGLPDCSSHGLRKAISRRMASMGAGNQGIKSVTGHSGDAEVALYTREVDQEALARETMNRLVQWEMANRDTGLANNPQKSSENGGFSC